MLKMMGIKYVGMERRKQTYSTSRVICLNAMKAGVMITKISPF
jgi:hypothetical protein